MNKMFYKSTDGKIWESSSENKIWNDAMFHYRHHSTVYHTDEGVIVPTLHNYTYVCTTCDGYYFIRWEEDTKKKYVELIKNHLDSSLEAVKEEEIEDNVSTPLSCEIYEEVSSPPRSPSFQPLVEKGFGAKKAMVVRIQENMNEMI